jgi:hypothetical protein
VKPAPKPPHIFIPRAREQQIRREVAAGDIDWGFGKGTFIPMIKNGRMVMMPVEGAAAGEALAVRQPRDKTTSNLNESYSKEQFEEYQSESYRRRSGSVRLQSELIESKYDEDFESYSKSMLGSRDAPAESVIEEESQA